MKRLYAFVLLFLYFQESSSSLLPISSNDNDAILKGILTKITSCFTKIMHVVLINKCNERMENVHIQYPHVLINEKKHQHQTKPNYYIICIEESATFALIMAALEEDSCFNPRAFFIVYVPNYEKIIFDISHWYFLQAVVVIDSNFTARTSNYGNAEILLGNAMNYSCELLKLSKPLWNETELKVALFRLPPYVICEDCKIRGIELDILLLIQSILKFRIEYDKDSFKNWGSKINGTYNNVYGAIKRREATLALGMFEMDLLSVQDFDMTYPYLMDSLIWVVPKTDVIRNINIVRSQTAGLIICTVCLISLSWWIMALIYETKSRYYRKVSNVILAILRLFFGGPIQKIPNNSHGRFIMILWIWTSFTLNVLIQSYLMYFLTYDPLTKSIDSYKELIESNLLIGLYKSNYPDDWREKVTEEAKGRRVFCNVNNDCLNRTVYVKDIAVVTPLRLLEYLIVTKYLDDDGNSRVHAILNEPILLRFISMCFIKGHPIYDEFERILRWIIDCGFIQYYVNWYNYYVNNLYNRNVVRRIEWNTEALSIYNVCFVFYVLFGGYCASFLCLLIEICIHYTRNYNERRY